MSKLPLHTGRVKQKKKTREEILTTAQKLLEKGIVFTLEDIANHINMSRATVYRYFSSVDLLCAEATLNVQVKSKEELLEEIEDLSPEESLLHVQSYFNNLAQDHEPAFRKYLSVVLNESLKDKSKKQLRGARRPNYYESILDCAQTNLSKEEQKKLTWIVTVLSGVEALVVNKDVNGIENEESNELLRWAVRMILKGMQHTQANKKV